MGEAGGGEVGDCEGDDFVGIRGGGAFEVVEGLGEEGLDLGVEGGVGDPFFRDADVFCRGRRSSGRRRRRARDVVGWMREVPTQRARGVGCTHYTICECEVIE